MNQTLFDTEPKTQTDRLLEWFKNGKDLTTLEAYERFRITQLGRCISDLEKEGHIFVRPRIKLPSGKVVCLYRLKGG